MKKIKSVKLKNFSGFSEFQANINPGVTYLVGKNGAGKTTVGVTAIFFILKGIAERGEALKGERFRFIGPYGNSASGELVLKDDQCEYVISRKITKSGNSLEIKSSDGRSLGQDWIDSFWSEFFVSPLAFSKLSGKEQAETIGVDVSEFNKKEAEIKEEAKFLRKQIKDFGEIEIPDEVPESIVVSELLVERDKIIAFNDKQDEIERQRREVEDLIGVKKREMSDIAKRLEQLKKEVEDLLEPKLEAMPFPEEKLLTTDIDDKIRNAEQTNKLAANIEVLKEKQRQKDAKTEELKAVLAKQSKNEEDRVKYLQDRDLPFSNLTIDDDGGLLLGGRPIQRPHFSTGELIKICSAIIASQNPEMKYIFIEDFDLLDYEKASEVLEFLTKKGFQVVCEKVARNKEMLVLSDINE